MNSNDLSDVGNINDDVGNINDIEYINDIEDINNVEDDGFVTAMKWTAFGNEALK